MTIKSVVNSQYRNIINQAVNQAARLVVPPEGWICTVRKSLNMSGAQLARRLGVTRAQVFKTEKAETSGNITLKTIQGMAEAMGCRFVYAIVPEESIDALILNQAQKKAMTLVHKTNSHMALEAQALSVEQINYEIDRLTRQMVERMPSDLWDDK